MAATKKRTQIAKALRHPSAKARYSVIRWAVLNARKQLERFPNEIDDLIADAAFFAGVGGPMFKGYDVLREVLIRRRNAQRQAAATEILRAFRDA